MRKLYLCQQSARYLRKGIVSVSVLEREENKHRVENNMHEHLRNMSTLALGFVYANWTAEKRFGAKYAPVQRLAMKLKSKGSLSPLPGTGNASASVTTLTSLGTYCKKC